MAVIAAKEKRMEAHTTWRVPDTWEERQEIARALDGARMSFDEWWALPENAEFPRTEWVDGRVVVMADEAPMNAAAGVTLVTLFHKFLPGLRAYHRVAVRVLPTSNRSPDVSVFTEKAVTNPVELTPVLVAEVLSPSTRTEDLVRKAPEYAEAGIGHYWILDPAQRTLETLVLDAGGWRRVLYLDDNHPTGSVQVGEFGTVMLDLASILDD